MVMAAAETEAAMVEAVKEGVARVEARVMERRTSQSSTSRIRAEKMPLPDLAPLPSGVAYDCSVNDEALRRGIHL